MFQLKILIEIWLTKSNMGKNIFVDIVYNASLAQKY